MAGTQTPDPDTPITALRVLITAQEAYPAFEEAFLAAQTSVQCGFRIFDLDTRLRSPAAQEIGHSWRDLIAHTLRRGVSVSMILSDFDPIIATELHRKSWASARQFAEVAAQAGPGRLSFTAATHPARAGVLPRLAFRHKVKRKLQARSADALTPGLWEVSESDLFDLHPVTHHQKLAVFDRKTLYIGGLDLDERRFDTPDHARAPEQTWADVQAMVEGPVAEAAARHLDSLEAAVSGRAPPPEPRPGFLRTLSRKRRLPLFHIAPKNEITEIEQAHLDGILAARDLIYLETQFFRHQPLADALAKAARQSPNLRLILILPAAPENIAFESYDGADARFGEALQARAVETVQNAFEARCLIASPARAARQSSAGRDTLHGAPIIYVHSKVSIFDETSAIVSSANLNGRSMRWDTEAGIELRQPAQIRHLRNRLLDHWFGDSVDPAADDVFAQCRAALDAAHTAPPEQRRIKLLPYDLAAAKDSGAAQPLAPNEIV